MAKVEYDKNQVCQYYNRDGGHCTFPEKIENRDVEEVPSLAQLRNVKRVVNPKYDPKYYCGTRVDYNGLLNPQAVDKQKKCSEYSPRRP